MALGLFIALAPKTEANIHDPDLYAQAVYQVPETIEVKGILKQYPSELGYNCYKYISSKIEIGNGFSTLEQKKSRITSYEPSPGKVGVTPEGPVGHLVIVEEVKDTAVVVSEGNYRYGFITWREIQKQNIIGYF